ncbi:MAG: ABC transporter ATP-binding protein [Bacilli bacterium]|nr:ABC transporter ATP-binding protein [Bacilli bacterium]
MPILSVNNLNKTYPKFHLNNVSFTLEKGFIMGFIGRNGAGKTTTLKSMMGLVHPDSGEVFVNNLDFSHNEFQCKQQIGFVLGGVDYFPKKKIKTITNVTKRFYKQWDEEAYLGYLKRFELDPEKKIDELSAGMKVKYSLALALSHHAELLILDEPTSGLDPVSRDDLLDLFQELIQDGEKSILFSTHITSDLERCADYITYIKDGNILFSEERDKFLERYIEISGKLEQLSPKLEKELIGLRKHRFGFEAMIPSNLEINLSSFETSKPNLETIMVHLERE